MKFCCSNRISWKSLGLTKAHYDCGIILLILFIGSSDFLKKKRKKKFKAVVLNLSCGFEPTQLKIVNAQSSLK
jgi:glycopeptide antibiotics resistance protein